MQSRLEACIGLTLMMASVWMYSMSESFRPRSRPARWVVLTIPVVTVFCREKGLPIATTNSPGRRSAERPNGRTGSLDWRLQGEGEEQGSLGRSGRASSR